MEVGNTNGCFICGRDNPQGLRLDFALDEAVPSLETRWVATAVYEGYSGILHGGMVATLLDEVVGKLSVLVDKPAVTAEMTVRFLKPVPTGAPLTVRGRITGERRRVLDAEAHAYLADGTLAASASFILVRPKT